MSYYEIHNDDEPIAVKSDDYQPEFEFEGGTVEATMYNKQEAPLEETPFKFSLQIEGRGPDEGRLGVDLVTILDINASMSGFKLAKMKLSMKFLLHKLDQVDRVSIVTFNSNTDRLCPLRQITADSKTEMAHQVDNLVAGGSSTKMGASLKLALRILDGRSRTKRRRTAIMLVSDGVEDGISDAACIALDEVPVYTFSFGTDCKSEVLAAIAKNSCGGIFTSVPDLDDLGVVFSNALAGILTVSIEDLSLTFIPHASCSIFEAYCQHYQQVLGREFHTEFFQQPGLEEDIPSNNLLDTCVTILFGSLYNRESRKVLLEFILPEVSTRRGAEIYSAIFRYRVVGSDAFVCDMRIVNVTRTPTPRYPSELKDIQDLEKEVSRIRKELLRSNPSPEEDNVEVKEEDGDQEKNYNFNGYERLREAVKAREWEEAHDWLKVNRMHVSKIFSSRTSGKEIFHLAKKALRSNQLAFAEEIVKLAPPEALQFREAKSGFTILHMLAMWGNIETVRLVVKKDPKLTQVSSHNGAIPFLCAVKASDGENEVLKYLFGVTKFEDANQFSGGKDGALVSHLVEENLYGMALSVMELFPVKLIDAKVITPLELIVSRPFSFHSGADLVWWESFIYSIIEMDPYDCGIQGDKGTKNDEENPQKTSKNKTSEASTGSSSSIRTMINTILFFCMRYLMPVPRMKQLHNQKRMHKEAVALVRCMLAYLKDTTPKKDIMNFFRTKEILKTAITFGTTEFVLECLRLFPFLASDEQAKETLIEMVIYERNDKILNFICRQRASNSNTILPIMLDDDKNTILHRAAELAPSRQLNTISGAALQMQREIQWFKGVENMILYRHRFARNLKGETAQYLFAEKHKDLMEKGEKWMKSTSESCMLVATLIATVAFATAFTVPGGNISDNNSNNNGNPVFLKSTSFVIFAVADALALFSSITSVLMFLAVVTSRYSEVDFLKSLPQKLILGLATLFISMATILVAFVAAFSIVLGDRYPWAVIPVSLVACVPVVLFMLMQLPLFLEMVRHTYWPVRFGEHNQRRGVKQHNIKKEKQN